MRLVIDSNVLFSALIKQGMTAELVFDDNISLYAPEFIFQEFEAHKNTIMDKTRRPTGEYSYTLERLKKKVSLVTYVEISKHIRKAVEISPDIKDVDYFALALKLDCPIWSQDKLLKTNQNQVRIIDTTELSVLLYKYNTKSSTL